MPNNRVVVIEYSLDEAVHFVPQVIGILNDHGFLVSSPSEAIQCLRVLCAQNNENEVAQAMFFRRRITPQ